MSIRRILLVTLVITSLSVVTASAADPDSAGAAGSTSMRTLDETSGIIAIQVLGQASPMIRVDRTALNFGAVIEGAHTGTQTFMVYNSGGGSLDWTASPSEPWMQLVPSTGTSDETAAVGVGLDLTDLPTGTYTGTITIEDPSASNSPVVLDSRLEVLDRGDSPPFGTFDTPVDGSHVRGAIPITGWVLDDLEVKSVHIYRQDGGNLIYIAEAGFVMGARPDVEAAYPGYPDNDRAAWQFLMLTNSLPNGGNGTYTLVAVASDNTGHQITLGVKTIHVDNANAVKPFGCIDTPPPGRVVSGSSYINWGWALTPWPNSIPTDGSTISVYVDGVDVGHPVYNIYRADIATLFPGYANSDGAAGYFYLDTTEWANGVHTIQWTARDNAGNADSIGSRYFTILNPPPVYSWTDDVYVDDDFDADTPGWDFDRFASIQDGINAALSGGTVDVAAGMYVESVALNRFIHVSLSGDIVLDGDFSMSTGTFETSNGDLVLSGNFTHSGGIFDPSYHGITFNGTGTQTITGDVAFYDLTVGSGVILETTGNVTLNGTLTNNGVIVETKAVAGSGPLTFGLANVAIDVTEPGLTSLQVERRDQHHPAAPLGIQTGKYWSCTPTGSGFTLDMTLPHNGTPDGCDEVCRYTGSGEVWDCAADHYDTENNTITRLGITQLSDWATGDDVGPCHVWCPMVLIGG